MSNLQNVPKILYIEDELAQNIPRLLRLFEKYLSTAELERLQELEDDLVSSGYGADPQEIQQIFTDIQLIDLEYCFPDALSKILTHPEDYAIFIVDRNLSKAQYNVETVRKIELQYSQELYDRFKGREGDYILLKLVLSKKVDVLEKFYFLTAYSAQDELRSATEVQNLIDFGAFQQQNFIEKGNTKDIERLRNVIERSSVPKRELYEQIQASLAAEVYVFNFNDKTTMVRGTFVSPVLRIKTSNGKRSINTSQIQKITRIDRYENTDFKFELKTKDVLQGKFVDKKLNIKTQIDPNFQVFSQNIQSVELE